MNDCLCTYAMLCIWQYVNLLMIRLPSPTHQTAFLPDMNGETPSIRFTLVKGYHLNPSFMKTHRAIQTGRSRERRYWSHYTAFRITVAVAAHARLQTRPIKRIVIGTAVIGTRRHRATVVLGCGVGKEAFIDARVSLRCVGMMLLFGVVIVVVVVFGFGICEFCCIRSRLNLNGIRALTNCWRTCSRNYFNVTAIAVDQQRFSIGFRKFDFTFGSLLVILERQSAKREIVEWR